MLTQGTQIEILKKLYNIFNDPKVLDKETGEVKEKRIKKHKKNFYLTKKEISAIEAFYYPNVFTNLSTRDFVLYAAFLLMKYDFSSFMVFVRTMMYEEHTNLDNIIKTLGDIEKMRLNDALKLLSEMDFDGNKNTFLKFLLEGALTGRCPLCFKDVYMEVKYRMGVDRISFEELLKSLEKDIGRSLTRKIKGIFVFFGYILD